MQKGFSVRCIFFVVGNYTEVSTFYEFASPKTDTKMHFFTNAAPTTAQTCQNRPLYVNAGSRLGKQMQR